MQELNDKKALAPKTESYGENLKPLGIIPLSLLANTPIGRGTIATLATLGIGQNQEADGSVINSLGKVLNKKGLDEFQRLAVKKLNNKATFNDKQRLAKALNKDEGFPFLADYVHALQSGDKVKANNIRSIVNSDSTFSTNAINTKNMMSNRARASKIKTDEASLEDQQAVKDMYDAGNTKIDYKLTDKDINQYNANRNEVADWIRNLDVKDIHYLSETGMDSDLANYKMLTNTKVNDKIKSMNSNKKLSREDMINKRMRELETDGVDTQGSILSVLKGNSGSQKQVKTKPLSLSELIDLGYEME